MQFSGLFARVRRGATYREITEIGTTPIVAYPLARQGHLGKIAGSSD
jgi:hypothetical protein